MRAMMRTRLGLVKVVAVALVLALGAGGCGVISNDLAAAGKRLGAAQAAGILPANDLAVKCVAYLQGQPAAVSGAAQVLAPPFAGVADFGAEGYIFDALTQRAGSSDALDAECAPVIF